MTTDRLSVQQLKYWSDIGVSRFCLWHLSTAEVCLPRKSGPVQCGRISEFRHIFTLSFPNALISSGLMYDNFWWICIVFRLDI